MYVEQSDTTSRYDAPQREVLMADLCRQYAHGNFRRRIRFIFKRYTWIIVVGSARFVKRTVDIIVALGMLIILSPLLGLVALLIKLDGGPVFYFAQRVGQWGREFAFPKFRSMVVRADRLKDELLQQSHHENSKTFKIKNDPRITWIGRIIRKLSIDELPQLWCVLVGTMSLVGPRPPLPREVAEYTLTDRRRLDTKPGLTCIWQVSGRGDIPFPEQVELDVRYIESQNLWLDIKLLFKTVPAVLVGKGAY